MNEGVPRRRADLLFFCFFVRTRARSEMDLVLTPASITSRGSNFRHIGRWKNGLIETDTPAIIGDSDLTRIKMESNQWQMRN